MLRGDTDFSQTPHLDRWHEQGDVRFVFGFDVHGVCSMSRPTICRDIGLETAETAAEIRGADQAPRDSRERVKQQIVEQRGFKDIRLVDEWVAEMRVSARRPAKHTYRMIIVRKNLAVSEPRQQTRCSTTTATSSTSPTTGSSTPEEIVFSANDRCQQENLLAQLKRGVSGAARAGRQPALATGPTC